MLKEMLREIRSTGYISGLGGELRVVLDMGKSERQF